MPNPVTHLLQWLKSHDNDIQGELAFLISAEHPSFDFHAVRWESDDGIKQFYEKIEGHSGGEIGDIGFVLAFRAIFDFMISNKRGTVEGWSEPQKMFESVLESTDPDQPSGMKDTALKMLDALPARREKWIAICKQWQNLKNSALSDAALEAWERDNFLARGKDTVPPVIVRGTVI